MSSFVNFTVESGFAEMGFVGPAVLLVSVDFTGVTSAFLLQPQRITEINNNENTVFIKL